MFLLGGLPDTATVSARVTLFRRGRVRDGKRTEALTGAAALPFLRLGSLDDYFSPLGSSMLRDFQGNLQDLARWLLP